MASFSEQVPSPNDLTQLVFEQIDDYIRGERNCFDFPIALKGTSFQMKVWNIIHQIPYGEVRSYKQIALEIGTPQAARAVGTACGRNPILLAIPCHRVVTSSGKVTGFAGGPSMRQYLLELEKNSLSSFRR